MSFFDLILQPPDNIKNDAPVLMVLCQPNLKRLFIIITVA